VGSIIEHQPVIPAWGRGKQHHDVVAAKGDLPMLRSFVAAVLALVIFAGGLLAAEGTVVSFSAADKASKTPAKVVVKVGEKEQSIELVKGTKVVDADGKPVKGKDLADALKAGVKVDLTEADGKVSEIKIKK
jgi:hypothetical protein